MDNRYLWNRKTIEDVIYTEGTGIHSGKYVQMRLLPADVETGIVFINKKYGMKSQIRASADFVIDTRFAITLGNGDWSVMTVEHLLSVLYCFGITDCIIELDERELPIFDGSAAPIINLFSEKKFYIYERENAPIEIINPIWIIDGDKFIIVLPSDVPKISYTISYDDDVVGTQYAHFPIDKEVFISEIAPARTFGFERDIDALKKSSLAKGGSLQNALVVGDDRYLNEPRFGNECVRHKVLDFIGDLSLVGKPVLGYFIVCKSGHTCDMTFINKLKNIYSKIEIGKRPSFSRRAEKKDLGCFLLPCALIHRSILKIIFITVISRIP